MRMGERNSVLYIMRWGDIISWMMNKVILGHMKSQRIGGKKNVSFFFNFVSSYIQNSRFQSLPIIGQSMSLLGNTIWVYEWPDKKHKWHEKDIRVLVDHHMKSLKFFLQPVDTAHFGASA